FETGRLSARDAIRIIAAGLSGGGHDCTEAQIETMRVEGGAAGYVDIVARLLAATFGPARPAHAASTTAEGSPTPGKP
ncbi:MAG: gene transfer agent family protein, partial [Alphaproteobacteria bacterium]